MTQTWRSRWTRHQCTRVRKDISQFWRSQRVCCNSVALHKVMFEFKIQLKPQQKLTSNVGNVKQEKQKASSSAGRVGRRKEGADHKTKRNCGKRVQQKETDRNNPVRSFKNVANVNDHRDDCHGNERKQNGLDKPRQPVHLWGKKVGSTVYIKRKIRRKSYPVAQAHHFHGFLEPLLLLINNFADDCTKIRCKRKPHVGQRRRTESESWPCKCTKERGSEVPRRE
jgi:hypothetical protein